MSQTFQIRRRVGAQQRQTNSTDRYLLNILQLSAAFRRPLSFGNITKLEQRFPFQNTFMCVCCVSGKFVWKVVTNGSVLWQLSLSPHHSSCPIWSQQLTLLSVPFKDKDKDQDQYRCNHNDKDKYRGHDIWFGFMATLSLTSSFFLSHLIPTVDPIERLFKHSDKEKTETATRKRQRPWQMGLFYYKSPSHLIFLPAPFD